MYEMHNQKHKKEKEKKKKNEQNLKEISNKSAADKRSNNMILKNERKFTFLFSLFFLFFKSNLLCVSIVNSLNKWTPTHGYFLK